MEFARNAYSRRQSVLGLVQLRKGGAGRTVNTGRSELGIVYMLFYRGGGGVERNFTQHHARLNCGARRRASPHRACTHSVNVF